MDQQYLQSDTMWLCTCRSIQKRFNSCSYDQVFAGHSALQRPQGSGRSWAITRYSVVKFLRPRLSHSASFARNVPGTAWSCSRCRSATGWVQLLQLQGCVVWQHDPSVCCLSCACGPGEQQLLANRLHTRHQGPVPLAATVVG